MHATLNKSATRIERKARRIAKKVMNETRSLGKMKLADELTKMTRNQLSFPSMIVYGREKY